MSGEPTWTVEIEFSESGDRTEAQARVRAGTRELVGWGRARRNPVDPDVPVVGEELAASRALMDLSQHLLDGAYDVIAGFGRASVTS